MLHRQEYGGYKSDITRTWPVDSTFTDAQRDLYEVVLDVQRTCVSLCRSDAKVSLDRLHSIATEKLSDGLTQLGFDIDTQVSPHQRDSLVSRGCRAASSNLAKLLSWKMADS